MLFANPTLQVGEKEMNPWEIAIRITRSKGHDHHHSQIPDYYFIVAFPYPARRSRLWLNIEHHACGPLRQETHLHRPYLVQICPRSGPKRKENAGGRPSPSIGGASYGLRYVRLNVWVFECGWEDGRPHDRLCGSRFHRPRCTVEV